MIANDIAGGDGPPKHGVDDPENGKANQPVQAGQDQEGDQQMRGMIVEEPKKG